MSENILPLTAYTAQFEVDTGTQWSAGGGGWPESGVYLATIAAVGLAKNDKGDFSITVTLTGIGARETYDYIKLPNGKDAKKDAQYGSLIATVLKSAGVLKEDEAAKRTLNAEIIGGALKGKQASVYYLRPADGPDGKPDSKATPQEITYLLPSEVEKVRSGEVKITRRQAARAAADPLAMGGSAATSANLGGGGLGGLGGLGGNTGGGLGGLGGGAVQTPAGLGGNAAAGGGGLAGLL